MEISNGTKLGPFVIINRLVSGGMATVYRARQPSTDREVAIKVLPQQLAQDQEFLARFEREAKVLASLQHPHILPIIDFCREGGLSYIVMPLLKHGDLSDYVAREGGALSLAEIRRVMLQLADALDYAHGQGVIHRDLKPSNVLMDGRGNCLLSDFGIAKLAGASQLTAAGMVVGTPEYMSPEQGTGAQLDRRSDIYTLGVILFQLTTGDLPFRAATPTLVMIAHQEAPLPDVRSLNPDLPQGLVRVITTALAKRPEDRFRSAAVFAAALRMALPESLLAEELATRSFASPVTGAMTQSVTAEARAATPPAPVGTATTTPNAKQFALWIALIACAVAALALAAVWVLRKSANSTALPAMSQSASAVTPPPAAENAEPARAAQDTLAPNASTPPAAAASVAAQAAPMPSGVAAAAEPAPFDDFTDPAFNGRFNPALWTPTSLTAGMVNQQTDGVLHMRTEDTHDARDTHDKKQGIYAEIAGDMFERVRIRVRLAAPIQADSASLGVMLSRPDPAHPDVSSWWAACYLLGARGKDETASTCADSRQHEYRAATAFAPASWHELELAPDLEHRRVIVSADGQPLGELTLPRAVASAAGSWRVSLVGWSGDGQPVEGDIDWVRIARKQLAH